MPPSHPLPSPAHLWICWAAQIPLNLFELRPLLHFSSLSSPVFNHALIWYQLYNGAVSQREGREGLPCSDTEKVAIMQGVQVPLPWLAALLPQRSCLTPQLCGMGWSLPLRCTCLALHFLASPENQWLPRLLLPYASAHKQPLCCAPAQLGIGPGVPWGPMKHSAMEELRGSQHAVLMQRSCHAELCPWSFPQSRAELWFSSSMSFLPGHDCLASGIVWKLSQKIPPTSSELHFKKALNSIQQKAAVASSLWSAMEIWGNMMISRRWECSLTPSSAGGMLEEFLLDTVVLEHCAQCLARHVVLPGELQLLLSFTFIYLSSDRSNRDSEGKQYFCWNKKKSKVNFPLKELIDRLGNKQKW